MNKNILETFGKAKLMKTFISEDNYRDTLKKIKDCHENINIDWDDGAGEEWGRIIYQDLGVVGMIHSKIGLLFILKNQELDIIKNILEDIYIVEVKDFDTKEWYMNLDEISSIVPELNWCIPENAMDYDNFCLSDFYVVTV